MEGCHKPYESIERQLTAAFTRKGHACAESPQSRAICPRKLKAYLSGKEPTYVCTSRYCHFVRRREHAHSISHRPCRRPRDMYRTPSGELRVCSHNAFQVIRTSDDLLSVRMAANTRPSHLFAVGRRLFVEGCLNRSVWSQVIAGGKGWSEALGRLFADMIKS